MSVKLVILFFVCYSSKDTSLRLFEVPEVLDVQVIPSLEVKTY